MTSLLLLRLLLIYKMIIVAKLILKRLALAKPEFQQKVNMQLLFPRAPHCEAKTSGKNKHTLTCPRRANTFKCAAVIGSGSLLISDPDMWPGGGLFGVWAFILQFSL